MAATPTVTAPAQHTQPSRKGKKAWRKNVDLTTVTDGLEATQTAIIAGGIADELPDDALFITDTVGSTKIREAYVSRNKPLKADQILAQRSALPAISTRKRLAESDPRGEKKRKRDGVSGREYARLRNKAFGGESVYKDVVTGEGDASYDPWDMPVPEKKPEYDFLEEKKPIKEPVTLKHKSVSLAADGREIKAVRKPAAEKSYNPTFEDWSTRFDREGAKEVEREQKRLHEIKRLEELAAKAAIAEAEEEQIKQWDSEWESEWEGIATEDEQAPETKKKPERKTLAQRNKMKRRKVEEAKKKHELKQKAKDQQTQRIKALLKEVKAKERLKAEKLSQQALVPIDDSSSDDGDDVALRLKRFSKAPIPEAPLEVLLAEDLPDSLRRLKPEGNHLQDRYRTMVLRGKVESRRAQVKRGKQKKFTEKWTYKDWKLSDHVD
ncbi:P60-like protein [Microthyrium microscopicum]|uniref:Ribosome biogenesis protein NOP53 n=1 Tax=Microthyrium microscopicum TaxID=703497 RepID=A0A6A6UI24_9PEZI|nr:P60-like protein [Microthyrium microscopicum]